MDLDRAMQFILDVQAQHAAMMQEHAATMQEHAAIMKAQAATLQAHTSALRELDIRLATVTDLVGRLAQTELKLAADMRTLRESQSASDERLNALISVVDRIVGHNGRN